VKINPDKLRTLAEQAGATPEQLGAALPRRTERRKEAEEAVKKVNNWMAGKNHPAAKADDVAALARALSCEPKDIVRYTTTYRFARSSPRKARLLADLIRGRRIDEAEMLLRFNPKRAAVMVNKALLASRDEAANNNASVERLVVAETRVDDSFRIKRFQPKDRGRAHPIIKRTCHITVALEEV